MTQPRFHGQPRSSRSRKRSRLTDYRRPFRLARIEPLEQRQLLSAVPTLAGIGDVTLEAGAPFHIALDGFDADGDALSYTVAVDGSDQLTATVPEGNRSLRMSVAGFGDMVFELFEDQAPITTARIIELAQSGFYDGLTFHRIVEDFMIQGGDPLGNGTGGSGVSFDDEFNPDLQQTGSGLLSMANSGDDTNDSQFFITSGPARFLDFNHTIFGFLTEGESVRQSIAAVDTVLQDPSDDTSEQSKPAEDVTIDSVTVFTDEENGMLTLSAPEGTTGTAEVTVTVDDGNGGTAQQTFQVSIEPDTSDSPPFLLPIDDIHTSADTPVTFTIPGYDVEGAAGVEGNEMFYASVVAPANDNMTIETASDTGVTTVTPSGDLVGVQGILVGVSALSGSAWDTQSVPVFITPYAPTDIELLESADTGLPGDWVTSRNNTPDNTLSFRVYDVIPGAEVTLFADGTQIGQATASDNTVVIVTDGTTALTDGTHTITAIQTLRDQEVGAVVPNRHDTVDLPSEESWPVDITIDTTTPTFTSTPIEGASEGNLYFYDAQTEEETDGAAVTYSLATSPAGMLIDPADGRITWTPQPDQGPSQPVVVLAVNASGNETRQSFDVTLGEAPQLNPIPEKTVAEGSLLTFPVTASNTSDKLTFTFQGPPPEGVSLDADSGVFRWTPSENQGPAFYELTIRGTDAAGLWGETTVVINVTEVNQPPVLTPLADRTVEEGRLLRIDVAVNDADLPADTLTFSLGEGAPAGAAIDPATGRFTFQPDESQGGNAFPIVVRVSDATGATAEEAFTITVEKVDQPPVFTEVATQFVEPGDQLSLPLQATDTDLPAKAIVYSLEPNSPPDATIDTATGLLTWNVPSDVTGGEIHIGVRATETTPDGTGLSRVVVVKVVVQDTARLFDAALAELSRISVPVVPTVTLPEALLLPLPGEERVASPLLFSSPSPSSTSLDVLEGSGLFGTQIGPDTNMGGGPDVVQPSQEKPASEKPDSQNKDRSDQPNATPTPSAGSDKSAPSNHHAFDAALQRLRWSDRPVKKGRS